MFTFSERDWEERDEKLIFSVCKVCKIGYEKEENYMKTGKIGKVRLLGQRERESSALSLCIHFTHLTLSFRYENTCSKAMHFHISFSHRNMNISNTYTHACTQIDCLLCWTVGRKKRKKKNDF